MLQGASAAFLFPAALAIVVATYEVDERGKYLAIFFSISGALTAIGPIAGGYLTQWTWRSIFWINVPVAIIAIVLTIIAKPEQASHRDESLDMAGAVLSVAGMAIAVLGLQEAAVWGWSSPATWACLVVGLALIALFVLWELRVDQPLVPMRLFSNRGFAVDNAVLFLLSICFVPLFFFASLYAQIALGESASNAGLLLFVFFGGFTIAAQWGGRDPGPARRASDRRARLRGLRGRLLPLGQQAARPLVLQQWPYLAIAGAGMGLTLGPVSTDALNRAQSTAYGAVTGVTQTVRNFGGSLGLAVLGSILVTRVVDDVTPRLTSRGVPHGGRLTGRPRRCGREHRQVELVRVRPHHPRPRQRRPARLRGRDQDGRDRDGGRDGGRVRGRVPVDAPRPGGRGADRRRRAGRGRPLPTGDDERLSGGRADDSERPAARHARGAAASARGARVRSARGAAR